jgi:hypothetical protein
VTRNVSVTVGVVATLILSLLAASVGPVGAANVSTSAAADELVVGSAHQDFGTGEEPSPQTLENLTIQGSGDDATVRLADDQLSLADGFEDGDTDEWSGDAGITAQTSTVYEGTYAGKVSSSTSGEASTRVDSTVQNEQGDTIVVWTRADNNGFFFFGVQSETGLSSLSGYEVRTNPSGGDFQLVRRDDGSSTTLDTGGSSSSNTWYRSVIEWETDGTINVNVYDTSGNQVASLSATDHTYTSGGIGYGVYNGDSWIDSVRISGQPAESGTYVSATHNISNAEAAAINITQASNVSVDAEVRTDGGTTLATDTFTSASNHTLNLPETSSSQLKTVLDITVTGEDPQFELADESILFTNHKPQASNFSPANGTMLSQQNVTLSVDVSDPEFPTAQGDSVTAELFVDGSSAGTETVTSNQTVSMTHTFTTGGTHSYYWELRDSYGAVTTTDTRTLQSPAELRIYNVSSSPLALVDNASVEVRMFQNGDVYTRSTSTGVVDMSGVDPTKPFVVVVDSEGYFSRRIFVQSLYDRQSVYLLPDTTNSVDTIFKLQEFSGQYPQDSTVLQVLRPINGSWEVAVGDYFGANGQFPATLEYGQRYRLQLLNVDTGNTRRLGTYTPISSSTQDVVVTPGGIEEISEISAQWQISGTGTLPAKPVTVDASLNPADANVTGWNVTYTYVAPDGSTTTLYNESGSDPSAASVSPELNLSGRAGGELRVIATVETAEQGVQSSSQIYRIRQHYESDNSVLAGLTALINLVPDHNQGMVKSFLAMILTVIMTASVASVVRMSTEFVGITAWLFVAAFGVLGWVSYSMVFVAGVGAGSFVYLRRPI